MKCGTKPDFVRLPAGGEVKNMCGCERENNFLGFGDGRCPCERRRRACCNLRRAECLMEEAIREVRCARRELGCGF